MSQFPVSNSTLSASHLAQFIQQRYSLDGVNCRIIKAGVNDTYKATTSTGSLIFRVYSLNWRTSRR